MRRKPAKSRSRKRGRAGLAYLPLAGLALVILAVFWPTLHSQFVYDSQGEIADWDFIHHSENLLVPLSFRLMTMDVLDFNRPVAVTSLMFDSILWGPGPFGYHLTNILMHIVAAWLTFLLIRHLLDRTGESRDPAWRTWTAFLATLLFAVHPLVTEVVCEPANRKDVLAAIFGLTALLVAARHRPGQRAGDLARLVLCPFLCLLAIGSKEVGAAYPAILFLYWLLFRRGEPWKFWAWILGGSIIVDVAFLIARFALEHHPSVIFLRPPQYPDRTLLASLFGVQPQILALYLVNLFWPTQLCVDYTAYSVRFLPLPLAYAMILVAAGLLGWWSWKDRRAAFAFGFVIFCLLPVCNLVPIFHPAADRYLYNPLIGAALLVALALDGPWLALRPTRQAFAVVFVFGLAACLLPLTLARERAWSSPIALWEATLKQNPLSFPAVTNLPEALLQAGRLKEARTASDWAQNSLFKDWPWIWADDAIILNRLGDHAGAERAARHAIALKPDIMDVDKMVLTLQAPRGLVTEFAKIAQAPPPQKK